MQKIIKGKADLTAIRGEKEKDMAKKMNVKVTYTELLAIAYAKYDQDVRDLEEKRNGNPEVEALIDHAQEMPKRKCEILNAMHEVETGSKLFED